MSAQAYNSSVFKNFADSAVLGMAVLAGWANFGTLNGFGFFLIGRLSIPLIFTIFISHKRLLECYDSPWTSIYLNGIGRHLAAYIMMWCLISTLVN